MARCVACNDEGFVEVPMVQGDVIMCYCECEAGENLERRDKELRIEALREQIAALENLRTIKFISITDNE